jgi:mRNA interferase MazF
MRPTTSCSFGDVLLVYFPFTDASDTKKRPAVVVSSARYNAQRSDLVLMAITSHVRPVLGFAEVLVTDWKTAGLLVPSVIKPVIATLERSLVIKSLGRLGQKDRTALHASLQTILTP